MDEGRIKHSALFDQTNPCYLKVLALLVYLPCGVLYCFVILPSMAGRIADTNK